MSITDQRLKRVAHAQWRKAPAPLNGIIVSIPQLPGNEASQWRHVHLSGGADIAWILIDGTRTIEDIARELSRYYSARVLVSDIVGIFDSLLEKGLVEPAED